MKSQQILFIISVTSGSGEKQVRFIENMCNNFKTYGNRDDIITLISLRNPAHEEPPIILSTLTRKFYFSSSMIRDHILDILGEEKNLLDELRSTNIKTDEWRTINRNNSRTSVSSKSGRARKKPEPMEVDGLTSGKITTDSPAKGKIVTDSVSSSKVWTLTSKSKISSIKETTVSGNKNVHSTLTRKPKSSSNKDISTSGNKNVPTTSTDGPSSTATLPRKRISSTSTTPKKTWKP